MVDSASDSKLANVEELLDLCFFEPGSCSPLVSLWISVESAQTHYKGTYINIMSIMIAAFIKAPFQKL